MKKILGTIAAVCALSLAACGDNGGGGSGVTGTWKMDLAPLVEAQRAALLPMLRQQMAMMKQQFDSLPADQREEAIKKSMEEVGENRDVLEAMLKSEKDAEALLMKKLQAEVASMRAVLEIKSDKTFTTDMSMGNDKETGAGTWSQEGDVLTFVQTTKNGKPIEGSDDKTLKLTHKDGRLEGEKDGQKVVFRR